MDPPDNMSADVGQNIVHAKGLDQHAHASLASMLCEMKAICVWQPRTGPAGISEGTPDLRPLLSSLRARFHKQENC